MATGEQEKGFRGDTMSWLESAMGGDLCEVGPVKNNGRFGVRKILYWNSRVLLTSSIWSFAQPDTISLCSRVMESRSEVRERPSLPARDESVSPL